jgi:dihydroorotate dehydrogenase (fumarate)
MDLSTTYLGFDLPHPFITGASPLADSVDSVRALEDAGAAAVVMRSLFEEQLVGEGMTTHLSMEIPANSFAEALTYFPEPQEFVLGPDEYLEQIRRLKDAVDIPIIASLNGNSPGGWLEYARLMEEAGADAIELHIYSVPLDTNIKGADIVRNTVDMVESVKGEVSIPLAAKLSPFYTSFANVARQLDDAAVNGLVLFNRFYQPDIDVENLEIVDDLRLSTSAELPLRLRWLGILSGRVKASLAVTGGVHTLLDSVKSVMSGAHAIQLVSAVMRQGPSCLKTLREDLARWLEEHEYDSLRQMRGNMSLQRCPDPQAFSRGNYMRRLQSYEPRA